MTDRQIAALNNLYAATIEVMEVFGADVNSDMRKSKIACLLENFLVGAAPVAGSMQRKNNTDLQSDGDCNSSELSNPKERPSIIEDNDSPTKGYDEEKVSVTVSYNVTDHVVRYSERPKKIDSGEWGFKRLKEPEDEELGKFFYRMEIKEDIASYNIISRSIEGCNLEELIPEKIVKTAPGSVNMDQAKEAVPIEDGILRKDGKSWKVVKAAIALFK